MGECTTSILDLVLLLKHVSVLVLLFRLIVITAPKRGKFIFNLREFVVSLIHKNIDLLLDSLSNEFLLLSYWGSQLARLCQRMRRVVRTRAHSSHQFAATSRLLQWHELGLRRR